MRMMMFSGSTMGSTIGALLHLLQFWRERFTLTVPVLPSRHMWKTTITRLEGQPLRHWLHWNLQIDRWLKTQCGYETESSVYFLQQASPFSLNHYLNINIHYTSLIQTIATQIFAVFYSMCLLCGWCFNSIYLSGSKSKNANISAAGKHPGQNVPQEDVRTGTHTYIHTNTWTKVTFKMKV